MTENSTMPLVSVLMAVYNGEKYLREAIDSILSQEYPDLEFVIVNDGSKDGSEEIILSYSDKRIRYIRNEANIRLPASLNKGLDQCTGKYVARIDADDICLPGRIAAQVKFLEANPSIGVLGTGFTLIDSEHIPSVSVSFVSNPASIKWTLCYSCPIAHPAVMMRRDIVMAAGGYDVKMRHAEDYELWSRLSEVTKLSNLTEPYIGLRKHDTNASLALDHPRAVAFVSARTTQKMSGILIPEEIALKHVDGQRFDNIDEMLTVFEALYKVHRNMMADRSLDADTRKELRKLFVQKAIELIDRWFGFGKLRLWPIVLLCLQKEPIYTLKWLKNR